MKTDFKNIFLIFFLVNSMFKVNAQEITTSEHRLTGGNWNVCIGDSVSEYYNCSPNWIFMNLKFEDDGTLIDTENNKIFQGQYKYVDSTLNIRIPKGQNTSLDFINFKIVWLNQNKFYSVRKGDVSGEAIYYFERQK